MPRSPRRRHRTPSNVDVQERITKNPRRGPLHRVQLFFLCTGVRKRCSSPVPITHLVVYTTCQLNEVQVQSHGDLLLSVFSTLLTRQWGSSLLRIVADRSSLYFLFYIFCVSFYETFEIRICRVVVTKHRIIGYVSFYRPCKLLHTIRCPNIGP